MGDTGDDYRTIKEHYKGIRNKCHRERIQWLQDNAYDFREFANGHVRITTSKNTYDAWLTTGRWTTLGSGNIRRNWSSLKERLEKEHD